MNIVGTRLTREEFTQYVSSYDFGTIPPTKFVVHHTAVPTREQWQGESTLLGIKAHYERKGWTSGPHLFVADDGIWLFTPMKDIGTHAGVGNASFRGGRIEWYSLGMEVVGNYTNGPWEGETKANALHVIRTLRDRLGLQDNDITFHRDWKPTQCPGNGVTKEWLFAELNAVPTHVVVTEPVAAETPHGVSPWARDGWDWQLALDLDRSIHPHQKVDAEWVFAILKKYHDLHKRDV